MEHIIKLGIDAGSSGTKYTGLVVFDSQADPEQIQSGEFESLDSDLPEQALGAQSATLELPEDVAGIVGKAAKGRRASVLRKEDKHGGKTLPRFVYFAMLEYFKAAQLPPGDYLMDLGLGVPVSQAGIMDELRTQFQRPLVIKRGGEDPYSVTVASVMIKTQPVYMAIDQLYSWVDGRLRPTRVKELLANGELFVIDWGSDSVDYAQIMTTMHVGKQDCHYSGTFGFLPALRQMTYSKTRRNLTDYELIHQVFRTGKVTKGEADIDFTEELSAVVLPLVQEVCGEIETFLTSIPEPYMAFLGGGGAYRAEAGVRDYFDGRFRGGIHLAKNDNGEPEPVGSIARGILKALLIEEMRRYA